jgi:hypothetical protein
MICKSKWMSFPGVWMPWWARRSETLTAEEYDELLKLTAQIEKLDVERLEYLKELACIRQISLTALMKQLNIWL